MYYVVDDLPQVIDEFPTADPIISFLFTPGPCVLP